MSILIKGMEMPRACVYRQNGHLTTCPLYDIDGYCGALGKEASHEENNRHSDCPLIEVAKHGRLIDADALKSDIQKHADIYANYGHHDLVSMAQRGGLLCEVGDVVNAPTIIEAEGEDD